MARMAFSVVTPAGQTGGADIRARSARSESGRADEGALAPRLAGLTIDHVVQPERKARKGTIRTI